MIRYRGRTAVYGELWYDEEAPPHADVDILVYRQRERPVLAARAAPFLSLVIDLSATEAAIMTQFGRDCRYKIRRAESKDGLRMEFIDNPEHRLEEFCAFYDRFAKQKLQKGADRKWLYATCNAGRLVLASVSRNDDTLVWHAHLVARDAAWLQYTCSCFRGQDNDYRALVGRANRWLHWNEMRHFKALGLARYDWGGLFEGETDPAQTGINRFKKEFGGKPVRRYDCMVPVTMKGRLWLPLRDAWRKWNQSAAHAIRPR